jgi:hypothetical protein
MNAREVAYSILFRFAQENGRLHEQIALALSAGGLSDGEKKYISNICSGVVRNLGLIDWKLSGLYNGDYKHMLNKIKPSYAWPCTSWITWIYSAHATVNEFASLARKNHRPAAAQVNGILRNYLREKGRYDPEKKFKYIETSFSIKYSFRSGWLNAGYISGARKKPGNYAANQRPYFDLRINTLR